METKEMTKMTFIHRLMMLVTALVIISCSSDETQAQTSNNETMTQKMYITIGDKTASVTLADNSATQALVEKLQQAPVTVTLNSSGGFEIWGPLGFSLPTSNERINAQPGDVILYSGDNICIFYGTNSWTYTRLGKIDNMTASELTTFLKAGENNISVTLSLSSSTSINSVSADKLSSNAYTLQGTLAQARQKGIIIQNGKKIIR
ncbi:MAG: hypothetical protein IKH14_07070 [Prevotella sp.]|nr:hypothetical protein [Prevotella sp.]